MQTIVLATQKGGSGKSTLAIGLALAAIRAGHNVRLIETDPQGTVSNWKRRRPYAAPIIEPIYAAREVEQRLQSLAHDGVTVTIVDTAGGESAATNSAIRYSDLCLIPTRPSIADIEATAATLRVIRAWHKPFAYVLNQTPIRAAARLAGAENALSNEVKALLATVCRANGAPTMTVCSGAIEIATNSRPTNAAPALVLAMKKLANDGGIMS